MSWFKCTLWPSGCIYTMKAQVQESNFQSGMPVSRLSEEVHPITPTEHQNWSSVCLKQMMRANGCLEVQHLHVVCLVPSECASWIFKVATCGGRESEMVGLVHHQKRASKWESIIASVYNCRGDRGCHTSEVRYLTTCMGKGMTENKKDWNLGRKTQRNYYKGLLHFEQIWHI